MCWSITATVCFALLDIITLFVIFYRRRELWQITFACVGYFTIMEIFQFFQWNFGYVGTCNATNQVYSILAFILVISQPEFFSLIGGYAYGWRKWMPQIIVNALVVVLFTSLLIYHSLGITPIHPEYGDFLGYDTNVANITCTLVGPQHHMVWKWAILQMHPDFQLNFT